MTIDQLPDLPALANNIMDSVRPYVPLFGVKAAQALGNKVPDAIAKLWDTMATRFSKKPAAKEALEDLLSHPDDSEALVVMRRQLRKLLEEDPQFVQALYPLAQTAGAIGLANSYTATIVGDKSISIQGSGNSVSVGVDDNSKKK